MCRAHFSWAAVAVVVLAGPGCSGGLVKVNGVVLLDGQPLEGAVVTFVPVEADKGRSATGTTDKEGNFQLSTTKPNDGVAPGEYKVTVVYAEGPVPAPAGGMKEAFESFEKGHKDKQKPPRFNVPAKYGDPSKTDLRQKVPTDGKVTLDLKSGK
jgi:hypothetical protein